MAALPVEGAERCAVSRAAGRRARRSTGQATAIVLRSARLGRFHLLSSSLTCPSDRRRLCRLRFVGVGAAKADAHSSAPRPRGRDSRAGSRLRQRWRDRQPRPGLSPFASRRPADLPGISERASSEVPGCGRLVPFGSRLGLSLGRSLALETDPLPVVGLRVRCLGPKTGWQPAGPPLATARFRRFTFHSNKGEAFASSVAGSGEEKSGSLGYRCASTRTNPPSGGLEPRPPRLTRDAMVSCSGSDPTVHRRRERGKALGRRRRLWRGRGRATVPCASRPARATRPRRRVGDR
jgi:hypothetical protein